MADDSQAIEGFRRAQWSAPVVEELSVPAGTMAGGDGDTGSYSDHDGTLS